MTLDAIIKLKPRVLENLLFTFNSELAGCSSLEEILSVANYQGASTDFHFFNVKVMSMSKARKGAKKVMVQFID